MAVRMVGVVGSVACAQCKTQSGRCDCTAPACVHSPPSAASRLSQPCYPSLLLRPGAAHPSPPARSFLPHIGRVTIIMNDYPMFKYALIAVLAVFVLTSKE